MASPILEPLELTDDERSTMERWARRPTSAQALALRCRVVLACATGESNTAVSKRLGVSYGTVSKWRSRFLALRLDGLQDEPRPGAPRQIGDDAVEAVVVKTLEETPTDATHWSTRSMAKATGMSQSAVSRIWRAFGLKPHLVDTFKLSPDPLFVEKVRDVVGLYINPPDSALVLCVDEKTQIQALDRTSPVLPLAPRATRTTHPRLCPGRHYQPLRRPRRRVGSCHRRHDRTPSGRRVPPLLEPHQPLRARGTRCAPRCRQRLDPQDPRDQEVAAPPSPLPSPLHAHVQLVDEPGRTVVRRTHQQVAPSGNPSIDQGTRVRHHPMDRSVEQGAKALRLAQERR